MQVLIIGDSFAADWTIKYPHGKGWPNLLAESHDVTNLAQAGVGEYKIYKQLNQIENLAAYKLVIVSHTSPYRVHTRRHPIHSTDVLHSKADLLINDIAFHASRFYNFFNLAVWSSHRFFQDHFDENYFDDIYCLLVTQIHKKLASTKCLVIKSFICPAQLDVTPAELIDFSYVQTQYPGLHNHLNDIGNQKVYEAITSKIHEQR
jgi:hypothetical protein